MTEASWRVREEDVSKIASATHGDPFSVLGLHRAGNGMAIRAFVPGVERLGAILESGVTVPLERRGFGDFFEAFVPGVAERFRYRLRAVIAGHALDFQDPYEFGPVLGPMDDYLLVEGTHKRLYERLGSHPIHHEGADGVLFAVWAPHARRVSVVGDFNQWDGRRHTMRKRVDSGIWELFAPGIGEGTVYKYEIIGVNGDLQPLKADPFGFSGELRPSTASVVARTDGHEWGDEAHMAWRPTVEARRGPMSILEVHASSWRRKWDGGFLSYDELADQLIPYAVDMGFTHIELMPISEHPLDASWGYQPIGLFAPTRRFGDPAGFQRFVDGAHRVGLGVILDWVPAHFPTDEHGLAKFDGTALYEHPDPRRGFHPDWNTAIYDFGRAEVASMLVSNAIYWLDRYHIDGLRVDAVASMLYLDYSRKAGEWLPNPDGTNQNHDAVRFLQDANASVYGAYPGIATIAEESTSWPGVSQPTSAGGLGFGFKWNMGWMNDTLSYIALDPVYRKYHHHKLTFGLLYAFSENFILPISHDEVVHGKGSVLGKMPGDDWQKFANVRGYYGFMWGYPGKKLLFMGQEFAQRAEWNFDAGLDWWSLDHASHRGVQSLVRDLNRLHREKPALHARDCEPEGFQWIVVDDEAQSVFAWLRYGGPGAKPVLVASNFTPEPRYNYRIGLPFAGRWREILNTDAPEYGGAGIGNFGEVHASMQESHGLPASAEITLPPLATVYFEHDSV
ncbi:glycogen branching protein [Rhodomicrobium udaipurense JA643]|uniref:1,4-alpha-glucan branching enzyme GlgB n=1 Tax=Rhodomicrobium udaipurense TaxID=1202716 RepID=A0A8I1GG39_9HYPH|nr:1,4-alpha-glucan branching protein GlgB [Rhodomicrobium udaipurense]KAI94774.1 glycogen branching protein [Rhodomicrobium udaipurense JA643]MBJ7542690.1 1,4-alpha-glucan branching protein GlgB [Rhodomicrobium udaipurense]